MSTESLKLQLIERLLRTTDEGLLKKVADLFGDLAEDGEVGARAEIVTGALTQHHRILRAHRNHRQSDT